MHILDENIPESQRQLLRSRRIQTQQIGHERGRQGMQDEEIIPLLHKIRYVTFFTRDLGFYKKHHCHSDYCLVVLNIGQYEAATFIRMFLKNTNFNTKTKRMGQVVLVTHTGLQVWQPHAEKEEKLKWIQ